MFDNAGWGENGMLRWSWIKLKPSLIFRIFWIKTHNSFWEQRSFSIQSHTHWKRDTQNKSLKARLAGAWLQILAKTGPCAASAPNKAQPSFFFFFSPPPSLQGYTCCIGYVATACLPMLGRWAEHKDDSPLVVGKLETCDITRYGILFTYFHTIMWLKCYD